MRHRTQRLAAVLGLLALLTITPAALAGKGKSGTGTTSTTELKAESAAAPSCAYATTPVFSAFGDQAQYFLAPGGDAETSAGWTGSGKVSVVAGQGVLKTGKYSFSIPNGGSLTSPQFCLAVDSPTTRFSVADPGVSGATLKVNALWISPFGDLREITIATVKSGKAGVRLVEPTYLWANLAGLFSPDGTWVMQLRFTSAGATWKVDDVYVDPFRRV